ncbi:MAG TPA: OPT family oligopeptide transporter [Polyangia bacterium]
MSLAAPASATVEPTPVETSPPLELTARALIVGGAIGAVLAAGNVYTGLKISIIDGGSITAALVGFMLFATFTRLARRPYSALENNITQTAAASAAIMGYVAGVGGPVPAMALLGRGFPGWALCLWGLAVGLVGIVAATLLRRKLVDDEALPFPTGNATGDLIGTIFAARANAVRRARFLVGGAVVAALVTWFRDGRPELIPQVTAIGGAVGGVSLAALTVGMSWSPLLLSTGVMMGIRAAASLALGAAIAWVGIAPWLVRTHIVQGPGFAACSGWLVWPGLGLLLAGSFLPLILDWRSVLRAASDLGTLVRRRAAAATDPNRRLSTAGPSGAALPPLLIAFAAIAVLGKVVFGLNPLAALAALVAALILAVVSSRATGETDLAPVGAVGTLTQLLFSGLGPILSILVGSISMGTSSQAAQTLWAFKAGQRLGGSPRAQLTAQLLGALIGGIVVVPVYLVIVKAYGIGTESIPAPTALSWRATAEAVRGGLSALPPHAAVAGTLGLALGVLLSLGARRPWGGLLPSPAAMGIAMLMPASVGLAALIGAVLAATVKRLRPNVDQESLTSLAAGGIAGESVMGVIVAILVATGILK